MSKIEQNKKLVSDFFGEWGKSYDAMIAAFEATLSTDCLLKMTKTPDLHGIDEIVTFMDRVREAGIIETMEVEVTRMIVADDCVVCERIDVMKSADGTVLANFPTFSVMDIADGKIIEWHDYFDSADMPTGGVDVVAQGIGTR